MESGQAQSRDAFVQSEIRKMGDPQKAGCIIKLIENVTKQEEAAAKVQLALLATGDEEAIRVVIAERQRDLIMNQHFTRTPR